MVDIFADEEHGVVELRYNRLATRNTHGAGCTLAAAVAAELVRNRIVIYIYIGGR